MFIEDTQRKTLKPLRGDLQHWLKYHLQLDLKKKKKRYGGGQIWGDGKEKHSNEE